MPPGPADRAGPFQEELLLRVAYAYEKLSERSKVKLTLVIRISRACLFELAAM